MKCGKSIISILNYKKKQFSTDTFSSIDTVKNKKEKDM